MGTERTSKGSTPQPGVKTLVRDDSALNLPTDLDREKQQVLPPGSATPGGGGGRQIPKFVENTPNNGIPDRPRTLSVPGEQYGHPTKFDYNMPTRRDMTGGDIILYDQEPSPDTVFSPTGLPTPVEEGATLVREDNDVPAGSSRVVPPGDGTFVYEGLSSKVASRYLTAGVPASTSKLVRALEQGTGTTAKLEESFGENLSIALFRGTKKVGYFRTSTVTMPPPEWRSVPEDCVEAWEELGRPSLWVIRAAEWFDPSLRGKGWGKLAYRALFEYVKSKGGVVGPDRCAGEHTSADAERVWKSLRSKYPSHGPLIRLARRRTAATMDEIAGNTSPEIHGRARSVPVKLKRADPKRGIWMFHAAGSKGRTYTVRVKALKQGAAKYLDKLALQVSCDCNFFRWQGPEHWAKANSYLYGKPRGTATNPEIKDPKGKHWACKHILAAFQTARRYRLSSEGQMWPQGPLTLVPDYDKATVVAARFLEAARTFKVYRDEYPEDSIYARVMAQVLPPPDDGFSRKEWELWRDWAKRKRLTVPQMEELLIAHEGGHTNVIVRGRPSSFRDLDKVWERMSPHRVAARFLEAEKARFFRSLHSRNKGVFYRGARKAGAGGGSGLGALGRGLYLTWDKVMAAEFARRSGGEVFAYKIPSSLKMLDAQSEEMGEIKATMGMDPWDYSDSPMYASIVTSEAKEWGYDGVISDKVADGLVIFDPKKAKLIGPA